MYKKSVFGLNENYASALAYIGVFVSGLFVYVMEKENKTVKFHALQSIVFFAITMTASTIVGWIPIIGGLISGIIKLGIMVSYAFLVYTSYKGVMFKIPFIGDVVYEQINK